MKKSLNVDKQAVNKVDSLSKQRESETPYTDIMEEVFNNKKGKGNNPNSRKNLKPFKKGQSGNPGGRPIKYSKLKSALDKWADDETSSDFLDMPPIHAKTMKEKVHWRIWYKASQGDTKCIEILAQLGCLDD